MDQDDFEIQVKLIIKNKHVKERSAAMGRGVVSLCRLVDETGSLNKAAHEMGMAYSRAWGLIKRTEEAFGFPLLRRKGNKGSELTPEAHRIVAAYGELQTQLDEEASRLLEDLLS